MRAVRLLFVAPRQVALEPVDLPQPCPGRLLVRTLYSGISTGTELLAYRGLLDPDLPVDDVTIENLWVDGNTKDKVTERNVSTSVYLRNQNEGPTARVSTPTTLSVSGRRYLLNGSGSTDPEQRTLEYFWFEGSPPSATTIANTSCTASFAGSVWQGVTYTKTFDSATPANTAVDFYLLVRDPGCLTSLSSKTTVIAK